MKIGPNTVVAVTYDLHAGPQPDGMEQIESTNNQNPFKFLFGTGGIIKGFETNLLGLQTGDKFDFTLQPTDAYGDSDPTAVISLPIDIFKSDGKIDNEVLKVDNIIPLRDHEGNRMNGRVVSFDDQSVRMDFNHPLAGQSLHFAGEVMNVREATAEEIAHGHVH